MIVSLDIKIVFIYNKWNVFSMYKYGNLINFHIFCTNHLMWQFWSNSIFDFWVYFFNKKMWTSPNLIKNDIHFYSFSTTTEMFLIVYHPPSNLLTLYFLKTSLHTSTTIYINISFHFISFFCFVSCIFIFHLLFILANSTFQWWNGCVLGWLPFVLLLQHTATIFIMNKISDGIFCIPAPNKPYFLCSVYFNIWYSIAYSVIYC